MKNNESGKLPEEFSDEEKLMIEEEIQRDKELADESAPSSILVRGALLRCSCGTHPRRLNLPKSYSVYATDEQHPKVHQENCIVGDSNNISYYGVCKSNCKPDESEHICLEPYVTPEGVKTSDSKVEGNKCMPAIIGNWMDVKENDTIYDIDLGRDIPCLTTNSFMVCRYGGVIEVLTSGQEYIEE